MNDDGIEAISGEIREIRKLLEPLVKVKEA